MQVEKIKLGEELSIPLKWMQVMNVASGEELTVLHSEAGMMIMKPLSNLTDILSHLLSTEGKEYDSEEYEEYILHRSVASSLRDYNPAEAGNLFLTSTRKSQGTVGTRSRAAPVIGEWRRRLRAKS